MTIRKIFFNFSSLAIGKTAGDLLIFLLFVMISRKFGKEGIGQYSFSIALTGFFACFADFGLYNYTIKEMSQIKSIINNYFSHIVSMRLIFSMVAFGLLLFLVFFLSFPLETKVLIIIIGGYQILYRFVNGLMVVFVVNEEMHYVGLLEFLQKVTIFLAGAAIIFAGGNIFMTVSVFPIATFLQFIVVFLIIGAKYELPKLLGSVSFFRSIFRKLLPYTISVFLVPVNTRLDVVVLGFILGTAATGVYNVAYRLVFFLLFFPYYVGLTLFPMASKLYRDSIDDLKRLYHKSLNLIVLIGLPASFGLWLIAPQLIEIIYGNDFVESSIILRFLSVLLFLACLRSIMGTFLTSCGRQSERTAIQLGTAVVNILAIFLLVPIWGIKGAAIATLISETFLVSFLILRLKSLFGLPQIGYRLVLSSIGIASFLVPFIIFPSVPLPIVIPSSIVLYSMTLFMFKAIRQNEARMLVALIKGESRSLA